MKTLSHLRFFIGDGGVVEIRKIDNNLKIFYELQMYVEGMSGGVFFFPANSDAIRRLRELCDAFLYAETNEWTGTP